MRALQRFDAISLDDLVSEAALMTRIDRKYLVPADAVPALLAALDSDTRVLEIAGRRSFRYDSVYFDTPDLRSYFTAAHPRRRRFKVRTRSYVDTGGAFLEVKLRGSRGATQKDRTAYPAGNLATLSDEARREVASTLVDGGVVDVDAADLRPTMTSRYRRATLLAATGDARATIDTELEWIDHDGDHMKLPTMAIIETKSASRPSDVDRCLWRLGHRPQSMSKYATGMAALRPHLPANRWTRLLQGPFATAERHAAVAG